MDFENVTNEPAPEFRSPEDPFLKPEDTGAIPPLTDVSSNENNKKTLAILLLTVFITLTIGSIAAYVIITATQSSKPVEDPYARYRTLVTPTTAITTTPLASAKPATPSTSPEWRIALNESSISLASLESQRISTISATLSGTIKAETIVCTERHDNIYQYFSRQKDDDVHERTCDETVNTLAAKLQCKEYDPTAAISLTEELLPLNSCSNPESTIATGTYFLHTTVFYNCDVQGKAEKDILATDCNDKAEVTSDALIVEE